MFFLWLLGPGLVFALSTPGTHARREAAKAFNFQLISFVAFVVVGIVAGITEFDLFGFLLPLMGLGWFILTIVGGAKALQGENWRNPVKKRRQARGAVGEVDRADAAAGSIRLAAALGRA